MTGKRNTLLLRRAAYALLCSALLFAVTPTGAQSENTGAESEGLVMNMRGADIRALIQWVADYTGRNMIVHKDVQGEVTVLSSKPVTREEAWQLFLATLEVYGFAAVDSEGGVKILPQAQATAAGSRLAPGRGGELVVSLIQATTVPAVELANTLRPLIPPSGLLAAYPQTNTLIVSASAAQVERIRQVIGEFEKQAGFDFESVALEHASAEEVREAVTKLVPSAGGGGSGFQFVNLSVDARSNSILLSGPRENREQIKQLIRSLDQEVEAGGNTQVIYLEYVHAEEMLEILKGVADSLQPEGAERSRKITIQASKSTNALIVNAPPAAISQMRRIVEQIDLRRPQVLIEALVVEVTEDVARDIGVSWIATRNGQFDDNSVVVGVRTPGSLSTGSITGENGPSALQPGTGFTLGYWEHGDLKALLRALDANSDANILSTPTIVALDNEEAELLVGQNVPFRTGEQASAATPGDNPFTTIERHDIGTTLKILPQINQTDAVTLELLQTTETIAPSVETAADIVTNKRSISTKALINDQQILVVGGLLQEDQSDVREKVPVLGNIPLLGHLFSSSGKRSRKTNLMVFIHPTILKGQAQATEITQQRYDLIRQQQGAQQASNLLEDFGAQELPDFETIKPRGTVWPGK